MPLSSYPVSAAVAVTEMGRATEFYEGKLGLTAEGDVPDGGRTYACGEQTTLHVFPSAAAQASGATVAGWAVDDLERVVDELTANGVTFEQYHDGPVATDAKASRSWATTRAPGSRIRTATFWRWSSGRETLHARANQDSARALRLSEFPSETRWGRSALVDVGSWRRATTATTLPRFCWTARRWRATRTRSRGHRAADAPARDAG